MWLRHSGEPGQSAFGKFSIPYAGPYALEQCVAEIRKKHVNLSPIPYFSLL
jgi:hypothetical protein